MVTLSLATNPGGATLAGTVATAAVGGIATFSNLSVNLTGTGYVLGAAATGITSATSAAFTISSAAASTIQWSNPAGGSWSNPANWNLGRVPQPTDSVVIAMPGTYTVTLDTTFTAKD
jgi:hypothetical protein